jgi:hypothetical protein
VFADAFAETVVEMETVALDVGEVMETVGGVGGAPEPLAFVKPAQPLWRVVKLKRRRNSRMPPPAFRSEFPHETLVMIPQSSYSQSCLPRVDLHAERFTYSSPRQPAYRDIPNSETGHKEGKGARFLDVYNLPKRAAVTNPVCTSLAAHPTDNRARSTWPLAPSKSVRENPSSCLPFSLILIPNDLFKPRTVEKSEREDMRLLQRMPSTNSGSARKFLARSRNSLINGWSRRNSTPRALHSLSSM